MQVSQAFQDQFGEKPAFVVKAPGRINLIGEHVDYLNGCVMPIAIDRHIELAVAPTNSHRCVILPLGLGLSEPVEFETNLLIQRERADHAWLNYVMGVVSGYQQAGVDVSGFRAVITTDLPTGAGLSSSAALETAFAVAIEELSGVRQEVVDRALICQRAEHEWARVPCGIMDQLAVGAGRRGQVLHLDCRDLRLDYFPIPEGVSILTADTGVKHALSDGEYRKRRESCEEAARVLGIDSFRGLSMDRVERGAERLGDPLFRRVRHVVSEMDRVTRFAEALQADNLDSIGPLMKASHDSLRDDYEVSCEELDCLVEAAYSFGSKRGLIGSRMTGGGFGGSTVSLVRADSASALQVELENSYKERFGREPNCFITSAVDGARTIS
ncbi:MAG: galactokinase [Verrucomicrobiota bacterium]